MTKFKSIIPISLFKRDTKEYLFSLETSGGPILLTVHGRGAFVVEHLNSYMRIAELAEIAMHEGAINGMFNTMDGS